MADLIASWRQQQPRTLSFCNTYMVAKRRIDPAYDAATRVCDTNLPDGMPLVWCMNAQGARMGDRVYGPVFMQRYLRRSPAEIRHYFLGGDEECLRRLCDRPVSHRAIAATAGIIFVATVKRDPTSEELFAICHCVLVSSRPMQRVARNIRRRNALASEAGCGKVVGLLS